MLQTNIEITIDNYIYFCFCWYKFYKSGKNWLQVLLVGKIVMLN